jgi:Homeodomain-like domain
MSMYQKNFVMPRRLIFCDLAQFRHAYWQGQPEARIARLLGVSRPAVRRIIREHGLTDTWPRSARKRSAARHRRRPCRAAASGGFRRGQTHRCHFAFRPFGMNLTRPAVATTGGELRHYAMPRMRGRRWDSLRPREAGSRQTNGGAPIARPDPVKPPADSLQGVVSVV